MYPISLKYRIVYCINLENVVENAKLDFFPITFLNLKLLFKLIVVFLKLFVTADALETPGGKLGGSGDVVGASIATSKPGKILVRLHVMTTKKKGKASRLPAI